MEQSLYEITDGFTSITLPAHDMDEAMLYAERWDMTAAPFVTVLFGKESNVVPVSHEVSCAVFHAL